MLLRMRTLCFALALCLPLAACDGDGGDDAGRADGGDDRDAGPPGIDAAVLTDGGERDAGQDAGSGDAGLPVDPLEGIGAVEEVQGGFMFLEGPRWREADGVLLFTDIPARTIYRLTPPSSIDTFRANSDGANGLATLPDGRLLAPEQFGRRVSVTDSAGAVTDFAARDAMGRRFSSPNDAAVRSDGTVYFTDPPYGLMGQPQETPFHGLYRVAPGGSVTAEWMSSRMSQRPNGVVLSPDASVLYLADTADGVVRRFDVASDGSLSGEDMFATGTPGADGMAMDTAGNLYVTTSSGVMVFAPDGVRWGTINVPMQPANCGFGDADHRTLYITARSSLYRVRMMIPGVY